MSGQQMRRRGRSSSEQPASSTSHRRVTHGPPFLPPQAHASAASAPDHTPLDPAWLHPNVDGQIRKAPSQVLATAGAGKDPFQPQPPPARRVRDPEIGAADPDLETVGALLEGSRLYVLSAAYVAGHAAAPVLIAVRGLFPSSLLSPSLPFFFSLLWLFLFVWKLSKRIGNGASSGLCTSPTAAQSGSRAARYCRFFACSACAIANCPVSAQVGRSMYCAVHRLVAHGSAGY